ncbi:MAG: hypothetical protein JXB39_05475 [Deltaproteobacteria bacterium]|nr:hypothetical protein [Deltaproteobacteria bacterium]
MRLNPTLVFLALSSACDDAGDGPCATDTITLVDADNFSFTGLLDVPPYPTVDGADVEIFWDGVTDDIRCHEVDPTADVANVGIVRFPHLTEEDIEAGLATNHLLMSDQDGYVEFRPQDGGTSALLSEFSFFGTAFDLAEDYLSTRGSYLLLVSSTTTPGVGALVLAFLAPTVGETQDEVHLDPGCGVLDLEVDLASIEPVPVCRTGPWTADWSALTLDGQGNEIALDGVDSLMLGLYEDATVADLEEGFLDLETNATHLWTAPVGSSQTSLHLADTTDLEGQAFEGFEGQGLWLLALRCSRCYNPAPLFLTFLEPVE